MRYRFLTGLVLGAAAALLALAHYGPVDAALADGSGTLSSGVVHLLLLACGAVIGWILRDERAAAGAW